MIQIIQKTNGYSRIAVVLGITVSLVMLYVFVAPTRAATLGNREVKLSDSRPGQTGVVYDFEADHTAVGIQCIQVQFCTTATGSCTNPTGFDSNSAAKTGTWTGWTIGSWTLATAANMIVQLTHGTTETGGSDYSFHLGTITNTTSAATNFARINTYTDSCGGTGQDDGVVAFAITDGVTVQATVAESLTVTLATETATNCPDNGGGTDSSDDADSSATVIDLGELATDTFSYACHLLSVSTNASVGYTTTVEKTQLLTSGGNTIADGDCTGSSCSASLSGLWGTNSDNGFGYCLEDVTGNPALTTDSSDDAGTGAVDWEAVDQCSDTTPLFKLYPTTATTENVMKSYTAVSGDQIRMRAQSSIGATQQAGSYNTVLIFVTTPTFN